MPQNDFWQPTSGSVRIDGMNDERRTQLATSNRNANAQHGTPARFKGDDIAERLLGLAAGVVKLLASLSTQRGAASLVKQLERCGPAGGANYEEARGAESPADFVHKVRIALKEVRETRYWLKLVVRAGLVNSPDAIAPLIDEADQLVAILTASANTARRRADQSV
jgi:four helix bundle protein